MEVLRLLSVFQRKIVIGRNFILDSSTVRPPKYLKYELEWAICKEDVEINEQLSGKATVYLSGPAPPGERAMAHPLFG